MTDSYDSHPSDRLLFETTHWSIVLNANEAVTRGQALRDLCERYWSPLYAYLRRSGHHAHDAQDLTQAFFTSLLENENVIAGVDRNKGRFRSYLLGSLKHFVANQRSKQRAQKRGGNRIQFSLDCNEVEGWYQHEPVETRTAEAVFRRRWGLNILERVLQRLEQEQSEKGKAEQFAQLKNCLTGAELSHAKIAAKLSMTTGAVKVAVHRLRQRYRRLLTEEISQTVASEEEVAEEIRDLIDALR